MTPGEHGAAVARADKACDTLAPALHTVCALSSCRFVLLVIDEDARPGDADIPSSVVSSISREHLPGILRSLAAVVQTGVRMAVRE